MIERIVLRRTCEAVDRFTTCATIRRPRRIGAVAAASSCQREDDTEEVVRKRYDEYLRKTAPLLDVLPEEAGSCVPSTGSARWTK